MGAAASERATRKVRNFIRKRLCSRSRTRPREPRAAEFSQRWPHRGSGSLYTYVFSSEWHVGECAAAALYAILLTEWYAFRFHPVNGPPGQCLAESELADL